MANDNFGDRYNRRYRERFENPPQRGERRASGDFPDWDPYGGNRDAPGRARYVRNERENWQTDDLGYSDYDNRDRSSYREAYPFSYDDGRQRGYSRQRYAQGEREYDQKRGFFDRAGDEIASWFGDEDAEQRRKQDQFRGKGPKGYVRADDRIQDDVNDRLSDDATLDASDIEVSVSQGEVTLNGFVTSRRDKRWAEYITEFVSGVTNVQNNLRVKPDARTNYVAS